MQRFDKFNSEQNGAGSDASEPTPTGENGTKTTNGDTSDMSNHKRSPPEDESVLSEVEDNPPPKKKNKKTKAKDEDDDAAFAARLQAEENARMGRATRGGNTKRKAPAPKKKTKKEIAAEKEALRLAQAEAEAAAIVDDVMEQADEEEAMLEAAERRPEVEWGVSADHPQPTVEDDEDLIPDVRGWQASLVDDEDLKLLADVLASTSRPRTVTRCWQGWTIYLYLVVG